MLACEDLLTGALRWIIRWLTSQEDTSLHISQHPLKPINSVRQKKGWNLSSTYVSGSDTSTRPLQKERQPWRRKEPIYTYIVLYIFIDMHFILWDTKPSFVVKHSGISLPHPQFIDRKKKLSIYYFYIWKDSKNKAGSYYWKKEGILRDLAEQPFCYKKGRLWICRQVGSMGEKPKGCGDVRGSTLDKSMVIKHDIYITLDDLTTWNQMVDLWGVHIHKSKVYYTGRELSWINIPFSLSIAWGKVRDLGQLVYDQAASKHNCSTPISKRWRVRKVTTECICDQGFALRQAYKWVGESLNIFITVVATDIQLPGFKYWIQSLAQEKGRKISVTDSDTTAP